MSAGAVAQLGGAKIHRKSTEIPRIPRPTTTLPFCASGASQPTYGPQLTQTMANPNSASLRRGPRKMRPFNTSGNANVNESHAILAPSPSQLVTARNDPRRRTVSTPTPIFTRYIARVRSVVGGRCRCQWPVVTARPERSASPYRIGAPQAHMPCLKMALPR